MASKYAAFESDDDSMIIWRVHGRALQLEEALRHVAMDSKPVVTLNWDYVLEEAIEAMASRDPASELRRLLREIAPSLAEAKDLLPRSRTEALQMIAILIALMSLWIAAQQSDRHLSSQDAYRLGHAIALEELEVRAEHSPHPLCLRR